MWPSDSELAGNRSNVRARVRGCFGLWSWMRRYNLMNYFAMHFTYFLVISFFGTFLLLSMEPHLSFVDALTTIVSCTCVSGLAPVDITVFSHTSQTLMMILIQLGGAVQLTIPILLLRRYFLRRAMAEIEEEDQEDLDEYSHTQARITKKEFEQLRRVLKESHDEEHMEMAAMGRLLYIVIAYIVLVIGITTLVVGTYIAHVNGEYDGDGFRVQDGIIYDVNGLEVNGWFFALFTAVSAFNNCGYTITVNNMEDFSLHPPILWAYTICIILGNTGFPLMLRYIVYLSTKGCFSERTRRLGKFLMNKSRTVYTHLFSWYHSRMLLLAFAVMYFGEVTTFLLSELTNETMKHWSITQYITAGLFQAASTRTGGFTAVNTASIQPGTQFVMMILMYIAVYPILFTIRRSDIRVKAQEAEAKKVKQEFAEFEHQRRASSLSQISSLPGTPTRLNHPHSTTTAEDDDLAHLEHHERLLGAETEVKSYSTVHLVQGKHKKDNSWWMGVFLREYGESIIFRDLTWLILSILGILYIEGHKVNDYVDGYSIFKVIFEVVSAYGTVGSSIGRKDNSLSFCSLLSPYAKLFIVLVMLMGRHRGLPNLADPAIVPKHYQDLRRLRARKRDMLVSIDAAQDQKHNNDGRDDNDDDDGSSDGAAHVYNHPSLYDTEIPNDHNVGINSPKL